MSSLISSSENASQASVLQPFNYVDHHSDLYATIMRCSTPIADDCTTMLTVSKLLGMFASPGEPRQTISTFHNLLHSAIRLKWPLMAVLAESTLTERPSEMRNYCWYVWLSAEAQLRTAVRDTFGRRTDGSLCRSSGRVFVGGTTADTTRRSGPNWSVRWFSMPKRRDSPNGWTRNQHGHICEPVERNANGGCSSGSVRCRRLIVELPGTTICRLFAPHGRTTACPGPICSSATHAFPQAAAAHLSGGCLAGKCGTHRHGSGQWRFGAADFAPRLHRSADVR